MDPKDYPVRVYETDEIGKGYRRVVFKPGSPSQSREMNSVNTINEWNFKKLASAVYPDGSVISGGYVEIVDNVIRFAASKTHISGNMFDLPESTVTITGTGDEVVGFLYKEQYVTATDDPELLNPAVGTANYGSPGADRIKISVTWAKMPTEADGIDSNTKFYPVYTFTYGVLQIQSNANEDSQVKIMNTIAAYNYSTNGSFVAAGMEAFYTSDDETNERHIFELTAGEAFVEGYQINNKYNQKFTVDWVGKSDDPTAVRVDQRAVANEPHTFNADGVYQLRWSPIATIEEISGIIQLEEDVIRTVNNQDRINTKHPDNAVSKIISVRQNSDTFTEDTDFTQASPNGDYIDWTNSPHAPAPNSTYHIVYHAKTLVTPDVRDITDSDNKVIAQKAGIYVSGLVPKSSFDVDYHFYMKRIDRIVLNRLGEIIVLKGTPHETNPMAPYSTAGLSLALVEVSRGIDPTVVVDTNKVYRMSDIRRLAAKVNSNEYNISVLALKDDIRTDAPMTNKSNMVVDPFANDSGRDMGKTQNAQTTGSGLMSGFTTNVYSVRHGDPILLDYTEVAYQVNDAASKARIVNAYSTINPNELGVLKVSPSKYQWVANETIRQLQGYSSWRTGFNQGTVRSNPSNTAAGMYGATSIQNATFGETAGANWRWLQGADYVTYSDTLVANNISLRLPNTVQITINASMFAANEVCDLFIDGEPWKETIQINAGTAEDRLATVTANADGKVVDAVVNLPTMITTGSRLIKIVGRTTKATAQTVFVAEAHTIDATVTYWYSADPLAQTYMTDTDCFITSVDIIFEALPTAYIDLLLAHTIVGMPDHAEAYNQKRKYRNEIVLNQWSKFKFDTPSRVEKDKLESFMVATSDSAAKIRVSELSHYDPYKKVWITKQGYASGTLLESSDAKTWSPIHTEDITFKVNRAQFSSVKTAVLGTVNVTNATDVILSTISEVYSGTNITYNLILVNRNAEKLEVTPGAAYEIKSYTGPIRVEATLRTNNPLISPLLFGDVTLTTMTRLWPSNYVSRNFDVTTSGTSDIKVILDQYEPEGSSIKVRYRKADDTFAEMSRIKSSVYLGSVNKVEYAATGVNLRTTQIEIILNVDSPTTNINRPYCNNLRVYVEPNS